MEDYQTTLRGLCPTSIDHDKVEQAIHGWEEYMKLMHVSGDDANQLFTEIIKDRMKDLIVSIAPPNAEEMEFYAFIHGRPIETNQILI